jgi:tetratricopeptide (TPR) repeat protein
MRDKAGDLAGARSLLETAVGWYPEEFTFHYSLAGLLLRNGLATEALAAAEAALRHGYGDNRLRAAERLARVHAAAGDSASALATIDTALSAAKRPGEELQVRTFRYIKALEDARTELGG